MSLNIKAPILKIATKVEITIPAGKLSKGMKQKLVSLCLHGCITGDGIPAQIACGLRTRYGLGYFKRNANSGWLVWRNLKANEMDELVAAATAERLTNPNPNPSKHETERFGLVINRAKNGSFYTRDHIEQIFQSVKLRSNDKLSAFCDDLINGKIKNIVYSPSIEL